MASLQAGNRGDKTTLVEFEQPVNIELLKSIVGVEKVELVQNNTYRIISSQDADIRASIFRIAAEQNWPLVGLRQEENSLEQIFQQLTRN